MNRTLKNYSTPILTFIAGAAVAGALSASAASSTTTTSTTQPAEPCHGGMHENLTDAEKQARKTAMDTQIASILGISVTDLQAKLTAGTSMKDIITASGISETDFQTKMEAARTQEMKTRLAADVSSGKITQTQADEMLTNMQNHKGHPGKGSFGGRGQKPANTTTTTSN